MNHSPNITNIRNIINYVNQFIPEKYTITPFENKYKTLVNNFTMDEKDCHQDVVSLPGLLIFNNENNELMAYVTYSFEKTSEGEEFLGINLSCTSLKYRRRQLSTYLRIVLFLYSIQNNIKYIASDVNPSSQSLLRKFGFKGKIDVYLEQFNWTYTSSVNTNNFKFKKAVNDFFNKRQKNQIVSYESKKKKVKKLSF